MFLDDAIYKECEDFVNNTKADIRSEKAKDDFHKTLTAFMNMLLEMANNRIKEQLHIDMKSSDAIAIVDRTFTMWDLAAKKLAKENHIMATIVTEGAFKKSYLADEKINEWYKSAKGIK